MRNKGSSRTTPEGLLKQYVDAVVQPESVLDELVAETVDDLAAVIEAHRTPAARHDALVNVLGLLILYIGLGVSGPRSLTEPLSASREEGEGNTHDGGDDDVARTLRALVALGFIHVVGTTEAGEPLYQNDVEKWDAAGGPDAVAQQVAQHSEDEEARS